MIRTKVCLPWIVLVSDLRRYLGRACDACSANPARVIFFEARIGKGRERIWLRLASIDATLAQLAAGNAAFAAGRVRRVCLADRPSAGKGGHVMDDRRPHLGIVRIRESHGGQILIFPRRVVSLFGLQAGDEVVLRKRRGREQYFVTFWREGKRLRPLTVPSRPSCLPLSRPRKDQSG